MHEQHTALAREAAQSSSQIQQTALAFLARLSSDRTTAIPRHYWAGGRFRISRGWLHRDLQELQDLFLLECWGTILIELNTVDRNAIARDLRQAINHPTECSASFFALSIVGK